MLHAFLRVHLDRPQPTLSVQAERAGLQGISLCWLVFNTIPHLNLLFYSAFGPGGFMVGWCRFGMFVTTATSALAIVLMWLLYPREVDFRQPLIASIRFLQVRLHPLPGILSLCGICATPKRTEPQLGSDAHAPAR